MKTHELFATPETVHYGYYDHRLDPVLTVESGDRVVAHTVSARDGFLPDDAGRIPAGLTDILARSR
ncbi:MAG: amidase, partial [Nitrospinota bacterium]|nr:amidase [Nitrospinota bacterium]